MWSSTSYGIDFISIYVDFALQLSVQSGTPPDSALVFPFEHVHNNNPDNSNRIFKLFGIYLEEKLT
jgi:hypothetical protein